MLYANVCMVVVQGKAPLHLAAYYGTHTTVTELLKHGADIDAEDEKVCCI